MRSVLHWIAGIAVTGGLAIVGWQNPKLGVALIVAGALIWLLTHERILSVLQRGSYTMRALVVAVTITAVSNAVGSALIVRYFLIPPCPIVRSSAWGATADGCYSVIVTSDLDSYAKKYRIGIVCGFIDPRIDQMEDTDITVSEPFTISQPSVAMMATWKKPELVTRSRVPGEHVWQTAFILPKEIEMSKITKKADIEKLGGEVLGPLPPTIH